MRMMLTMLLAAAALPASAQDFPGYGGKAQNQARATVITWQCTPATFSPITCTLAETAVEHPPGSDVETEAAKMLAPEFLKECGEVAKMRQQVSGSLDAAKASGQMDDAQALAVTNHMAALERVCADRDRASVSALVDLQNDVAARTCYVTTSMRKVEFDWNASSNRWESITPPSGGCGVIDITAMEKADGFFWNLRRQQIVTNRAGTDVLGESCAATSDTNEAYEWKTKDLHLGCEFVRFGF